MKRFALALGLGLAALPALAPSAWANDITVNSNLDTTGDDNVCTLREAIVAANTNTDSGAMTNECDAGAPGADQILFAASFTGMVGPSTVTTSGLPDITEDLTITSGPPIGFISKPRVGIKVSPAGTNEALKVTGGASLTATGLAITQASIGIDASAGVLSTSNAWFGLSLDQSVVAGNAIGVKAGSNSAIGDVDALRPNVFAGNTTAGLYIFGGDNTGIVRNNFGTLNDGTTGTITASLPNATNIRIVNDGVGANTATGNSIGQEDATTPGTCDLGCNLIVNATGDGIDLGGTGGAEAGATGPTTIAGNFIGLTPGGTTALPNGGSGIALGDAGATTIGGPSEGARNYLGGNLGPGISQGSGGTNLTVRNNYLGLDVFGTGTLPDINWALSSLGSFSTITNNRIGGLGVLVGGDEAIVKGNVLGIGVGGEDVGTTDSFIEVQGENAEVGGSTAAEGNVIGNVGSSSSSAILLDGDGATVRGNRIGVDAGGTAQPNDGRGITVGSTADPETIRIGGTAAGQGNVISNSGKDAIWVESTVSNDVRIQANTGQGNGSTGVDLFIDLGTDGQGNSGTNSGIAAPTVTSATATQIQGTSLEGATTPVDVYKTFTDRGDVRTYLGQTTVDGLGNWSFTYPTPLGPGVCVTAAQTEDDTPKGTSELAPVTTIGGGACDLTPPTASIYSGPSGVTNDRTPTFGLLASEAGSSFECSLDSAAFGACPNPFTTSSLSDGAHTLQIRATDPAGNTGAASATRNFEIDATAPQTTITRFIKKPRRRRAKVIFSSNEPGSTFECKLDGRAFAPCTSPKTYRRLKRGRRHTIKVRAIDAAGNADPTPTRNSLRIRPG